MKILLISESLGATGGWTTYTKNLATGLRQQGHDVTICSPESSGMFPCLPSPSHILSYPIHALVLSLRLCLSIRKFAPDIVHITTEPYALLVSLWPQELLRKTVLTIHGSYGVRLLQGWMSRLLLRRIFSTIPAFITVSSYTKKRTTEEISLRVGAALAERFSMRAHVIFNAIEMPDATMQEPKGPEEPKQILLVGPVKPRKGVLEAIEGCAIYRKQYSSPFVLRIIGAYDDSLYMRRVQQRMNDLQLQSCIRFEGVLPQKKLQEAYQTADLLLLPARTTETTFEGFGLVYIEAAGYGVPSIGPDDSGAAEAIQEGKSGYRICPTDAVAVAERMHWILDEHRITPDACRTWAATFSIKALSDAVESIYATVSNSASPTDGDRPPP